MKKLGFTLIELLVTLLILAIIAVVLFPFLIAYVKKAEHAIAFYSVRVLQDSLDRYRVAKYSSDDWEVGSGNHGRILTNYRQVSREGVDAILKNVSDVSSSNRTIHLPWGGVTSEKVVIVSTDTNRDKASWEIMRYRRGKDVLGVDRKGRDVTNTNLFLAPSSDEIDEAFQ